MKKPYCLKLTIILLTSALMCSCNEKISPDNKPDQGPFSPVDNTPASVYKWGLKDLAKANGLLIGAEFSYSTYVNDDSLSDSNQLWNNYCCLKSV